VGNDEPIQLILGSLRLAAISDALLKWEAITDRSFAGHLPEPHPVTKKVFHVEHFVGIDPRSHRAVGPKMFHVEHLKLWASQERSPWNTQPHFWSECSTWNISLWKVGWPACATYSGFGKMSLRVGCTEISHCKWTTLRPILQASLRFSEN
jgi:hypothetical protein